MAVYFPKLPCVYLSVDAMDVSGEQQIDVDHNIFKKRMDANGRAIDEHDGEKEGLGDKSDETKKQFELEKDRCESCYGAETIEQPCCNTCAEVQNAYRKKGWALKNTDAIAQCTREGWKEKFESQKNEGCEVHGYLEVTKVAGNFHFAPGKSFQHQHVHVTMLKLKKSNIISINMHDLQPFAGQQFNLTHHIKHLSFGEKYPGINNPLDDNLVLSDQVGIMYQYFVKIVPTVYRKLSGQVVHTNQFSVTKHRRIIKPVSGANGVPGVFVLYEFSPMMVQYTEKRRSFMHFLTGVCAIIGGVFTVAGLVDSFIYHSSKVLKEKIELGKAG
ncbi:endoplasmic reticulum-Golgi intermediate compartment protein 3-like isoform X1 [Xenia sp. Carnegie-2017]|uniref:endoplasmic reticulum-Golgi intermediate compartment protein 3-like isoform X1 n=1 Tax=Xenia sp. Carnegie-2017 TaxID=2897299 RepID=UPI001F0361A2|nr:endoplasmic reticulum-Golgi intermediate compartment protein 3-like isoform X1 [Xenia sp. Carnegie-2017]